MKVEALPNGFTKAVLEWNDRPDRDAAWYERESKSNPNFAREYLMLWGSVVGKAVFAPTYKRNVHEAPMEPIRGVTVYRGWDFGYTHPACVWAQMDATGQLGIRHELLGEDETIDRFAARVVELSDEWFPDARFEDFGDPAGHQRNDKSARTSIQILKDLYGIRVKTRPSEIVQGIDRIRLALIGRDEDGTNPGCMVDAVACPLLSLGFARSYIRDEHDPEKPYKDGTFDHLFDALRYMGIHVLRTPKRMKKREPVRTREQREHDAVRRHLGGPRRRATNPVSGDW